MFLSDLASLTAINRFTTSSAVIILRLRDLCNRKITTAHVSVLRVYSLKYSVLRDLPYIWTGNKPRLLCYFSDWVVRHAIHLTAYNTLAYFSLYEVLSKSHVKPNSVIHGTGVVGYTYILQLNKH